ncbi:MAG: hypothetical protein EZS28_050950, partial [Streblomastix strix]
VPIQLILPYFFLVILCDVFTVFQSWWMGTIGDANKYQRINYEWKIAVYAFCCVGQIMFLVIRGVVSAYAVKRSNRLIHKNLLQHVINSPSSFFDTTPMGRILNRFTGDITTTDQTLYVLWIFFITMFTQLIGQIVIISVDTVWFLAIGLPALLIFFLLMLLYGRAARNLQRLEAISRSPFLSHFSETVTGAGLSTI